MTGIDNAKVTLTSTTKNTTYTLNTGSDGSITFTDLPSDTYNITITKDGYYDYEYGKPVIFDKDDFTHFQIKCKLKPRNNNDNPLETSTETNTESDNMQDEAETRTLIITLNPATSDCIIVISGENYNNSKTTDDTGTVTFNAVPMGVYTITTTADTTDITQQITVNKNNNNPRSITINLPTE